MSIKTRHLMLGGLLLGGGLIALLSLSRDAATPAEPVAAQVVLPGAETSPALPDGILAKTDGDPRVWFIEDGRKRPIASWEAFVAQGFRWEAIIVVSAADLGRHPEGESLTESSRVVLIGEDAVLPDLMPFPAQEVRMVVENGRVVMRFTASFWNGGKGTMELVARRTGPEAPDEQLDTFQRIVHTDGTVREKMVGHFLWHGVHNHYHYEDFSDYVLELVRPGPGITPAPAVSVTQKTTFCLRDDRAIAPGAARTFAVCGKTRQGVSVGWADVYRSTLPDQLIDVTDLPAGIYRLSFVVDPRGRFVEGSYDNNVSVALIDIDPAARRLRVVATGANFATGDNRYPDGMLVRREGDDRVYVLRHNKKRLLRSEEVFRSYGLSFSDVYILPPGVVDAIPIDAFVRIEDSPVIYRINEAGYWRKILDPAALGSYGAAAQDVAVINRTEFASSPQTDLVMREGDSRVYSVASKRFVGTFDALASLGYDPEAVHVVTNADFSSYAVKTVAGDLTVPWDVVFLPDGDLLVTERSGTLRRIGAYPAVIDVPAVRHVGEGGLMGMALHPDFARNSFIYLYFTTDVSGTSNRVVRFRLEGDRLVEDRVILEGIPAAIYHDGGQVAFGPDGMLYITTGDANTPELAQDMGSLAGKTLRLTPDGGIPTDNPFGTAVWSYGHRNAQGIAWDDQGRMWQTEHGRSGALSGYDELNRVEKGKNYGWPASQGDQVLPGTVGPVRHSGASTTWAPSGAAVADGRLFFAGLRGASLYEVALGESGTLGTLTAHLPDVYGRLRAVVRGPDGFLYVTTSNRDGRGTPRAGDDKILRIHPDFLMPE